MKDYIRRKNIKPGPLLDFAAVESNGERSGTKLPAMQSTSLSNSVFQNSSQLFNEVKKQ